jgi:DNA-formamidopyrimidine glycosylase
MFAGGSVEVASPQGRFAAGARRLDGAVLEDVEARGKHLLYHWRGRDALHVHLGLIGTFRTHPAPPPPPPPSTRLLLANGAGAAHLIGPMTCALMDRSGVEEVVGHLGPDPLRSGTRVTSFAERIAADTRPIGTVLLDQERIAGVGNVYRSEVLFLAGIDPHTPASELDRDRVADVWATARAELRNGVRDGRIITVRPRDVGASRRRELPKPLRLYVYKREHRPCLRCRTPIAGAGLGGRRVWWCPECQR